MAKHLPFWLGFFAAALLAVPIAAGIMGAAEEELRKAAVLIFAGVAGLIFVLVLVLFFRDKILRKILGRSEVALADVTNSLVEAVSAAAAGDRAAATEQAQVFVQQGIGWYTWSNFYRWVIATALGLLLAFGAFVGTVLLFEQTRTLRLQTDRIGDQTKLMQAQTDFMSAQTDRLTEQTKQVELQNEILTLSLVTELRAQLTGTLEDFDFIEEFERSDLLKDNASVFIEPGGSCAAQLADAGTFTRLPSEAVILAIAKLGQEGQLADRVVEALDFLTRDSNPAIALSAVHVLDLIGTTETYQLYNLEGLYIEDVTLTGKHTLDIDNSIVSDLVCHDCMQRYERSWISAAFPAQTSSQLIIYDSVVFDLTGNLSIDSARDSLVVLPLPRTETKPIWRFEMPAIHSIDAPFTLAADSDKSPCDALERLADAIPFLKYHTE